MRESGSLAVLGDVNFFFIPSILAQKESRREPPSGWGGFKFIPCFLAEARPLAFKPPLGFLPSFLCHAGLLAIKHRNFGGSGQSYVDICTKQNAFAGYRKRHWICWCGSNIKFYKNGATGTPVTKSNVASSAASYKLISSHPSAIGHRSCCSFYVHGFYVCLHHDDCSVSGSGASSLLISILYAWIVA